MVPEKDFEEFIEAVEYIKKLKENLEKGEENVKPLGDYIEENQAMKVLKRGKTWFWNKRRSCELPGRKAAGRWYYKITDIYKFIENARSI